MQETLFDFPPKPPKSREFKAHVIDAGSAPDGSPIAHFECSRCDWDSGWVDCPTVTYGKRGIPCPACNQQL
ncbi:hypothetical protein PsAD37_03873 [Pseudovibrio sp. Ad37]|nr:hypothetical protein PsAD37_03873 [Pseudovibrio sp. Ad37]